jgi:gluconate kinase
VPVIIWINGGFGAGKTTLAEELYRRLPDAVVYDPEDVGLMLWKWMRPNGDFQHLPSWRELVVATALSLRRHHAETLIVPMSLIRDAYRAEILGGLADAGEEVLHVFLEADADVLRARLNTRVTHPGRQWDQAAREFGMTGVDEMAAAAARQPGGTLLLRSDRLTPAELADEVLARADLRQVHGDGKRTRQARSLEPEDTDGGSRIKRSRCVAHQVELGNEDTRQG